MAKRKKKKVIERKKSHFYRYFLLAFLQICLKLPSLYNHSWRKVNSIFIYFEKQNLKTKLREKRSVFIQKNSRNIIFLSSYFGIKQALFCEEN